MFYLKKFYKRFRYIILLAIFVTFLTTYFSETSLFPKKIIFRVDVKDDIKIERKNDSLIAKENLITKVNVTAKIKENVEEHVVKETVDILLVKNSTLSYLNTTSISNSSTDINECPLIPPNLGSRIKINYENHSIVELQQSIPSKQIGLKIGGKWTPKECTPRYKVAIIVPYRDRMVNLQLFLNHMHPFLSKQQLEYTIYLIEPTPNIIFNRGLLMNIGFAEALADYKDWNCFVFHDVDLLPEDERNIYSCPESPRHMSSAVSTLHYKLPYDAIFGGVTEFTREQFEKINGFSNLYFGWGGEDDDLRARVIKKGYTVSRYPLDIGRYTMAKHGRDTFNNANPDRFRLLKAAGTRVDDDGISSLKYKNLLVEKSLLYTRILVSYNQTEILEPFKKFFQTTTTTTTTATTKNTTAPASTTLTKSKT